MDAFQATLICMSTSCTTSCPTPVVCGDLVPGTGASCETCVSSACCADAAWCGSDPDCVDLLTCLVGCARRTDAMGTLFRTERTLAARAEIFPTSLACG